MALGPSSELLNNALNRLKRSILMQRAILAVLSDTHGGHRHGLMNPETTLPEENEKGEIVGDYHPQMTPIQKYLWEIYSKGIAKVKQIAGDDPIYLVVNGDITAGNKYPQLLVSDRISDQFLIAFGDFVPWYQQKPKAVRFIKGTGAHVFNQGTSEIVVSDMCSKAYPEISTKVMDHGLFTIAGVQIDISHHGPVAGSRNWLKGNEARYYLRSAMMEEIVAEHVPPRLYFRSHYHEEIEETLIVKANGNRYKSTLVITPSFAFIDSHSRQTVKSPARISHGMFAVEIVDGELLRTIPLTNTIDIRSKEVLE
jgi:hypothetical protein